MGKRDDSLPVYPVKVVNTSGADHKSPFRDMMLPPKSTEYCFGMTRLQHYAGLAMQAGISKDGFHFLAPKAIATISFDMAEAMIAEYESRYGGEDDEESPARTRKVRVAICDYPGGVASLCEGEFDPFSPYDDFDHYVKEMEAKGRLLKIIEAEVLRRVREVNK